MRNDRKRMHFASAAGVLGVLSLTAWSRAGLAGDTPQTVLECYSGKAKTADPAFATFSAERGQAFRLEKHALVGASAVSCASCHRKNPREQIKAHRVDILCRTCHVINDEEHPEPKEAKLRYIDPFAPHANPQRFTDYAHVEQFFKRNCTMVLKRECAAQGKGDLITWLLRVEGEALYPACKATGPARAKGEGVRARRLLSHGVRRRWEQPRQTERYLANPT